MGRRKNMNRELGKKAIVLVVALNFVFSAFIPAVSSQNEGGYGLIMIAN